MLLLLVPEQAGKDCRIQVQGRRRVIVEEPIHLSVEEIEETNTKEGRRCLSDRWKEVWL